MKKLSLQKETALILVLLSLLGLLIYSNTLNATFQFDDAVTIVRNPAVKSLSAISSLWGAFNTRFLTGYTFALNYAFGKLDPLGYHVINIFLHIFNAFLVLLFSAELLAKSSAGRGSKEKGKAVILLAAFLFLVHPVQTQAVSYVTQRASLLGAMFYLLTLIFYMKGRKENKTGWIKSAAGIFLVGVLTKEMMVTLPFVLILLELTILRPRTKTSCFPWHLIRPFFIISAIIPIALVFDQPGSVLATKSQLMISSVTLDNLLTQAKVLTTYLRLWVLPVGQNLDYDYPRAQGLIDGSVIAALLILIAVIYAGIRFRKKDRLTSFAIFWFFITIGVETAACAWIGRDVLYEHYLYLPSVGLAICSALWFTRLRGSKKILSLAMIVLIAVMGVVTYNRNHVWKDPVSLWTDVVVKSPKKARGYVNLGLAYAQQGNTEKAFALYQKGLELGGMEAKSEAQLLVNIGALYGQKGHYGKEIEYSLKALDVYPDMAQAYANLIYGYTLKGDLIHALQFSRQALLRYPRHPNVLNHAGIAYAVLGDLERARHLFMTADELDPDNSRIQKNLKRLDKIKN